MLYSPRLKGDLIRRLYQLKQKEKKPMTILVNEAVEQYLERKENGKQKDDTNRNENFRSNN
jgi:predicted transcriptional regulator